MTPGSRSIRRRVLLATVLFLAIAAAVFAAFIIGYARRAADDAYDRLLTASALTIAGSVLVEDGRIALELPHAALAMLGAGGDRVFYQVLAPDGAVVTGYEDLARDVPAASAATTQFADIDFHGEPVRLATIGRLVSASNAAGWVTIRVAQTRGARTALAGEIASRALLPLAGLLVLALALVWFGVERAFAPLASIEKQLRKRSPLDLSPLAGPAPVEVSQLVSALDGFMRRLEAAMRTLSGVVADTAHQVRTPLAALRAQAEVALEEKDPEALRRRVGRIHRNAVHASELVSQLLMEATLSHRRETHESDNLVMGDVVEAVLRRFEPQALERLRVTMPPNVAEAVLRGDALALQEMLRNLLANALAYSGDGPVDIVAARLADNRLDITVADRGPGIPDEEKPNVLKRFERGATSTGVAGSGLGLPIANSVAQAHGGTLTLHDRDGGGLKATVSLPVEPPPPRHVRALILAVICSLLLLAWPVPGNTFDRVTEFPAKQPGGQTLHILGTTDTTQFADLIRAFQATAPNVAVRYREIDTLPLYEQAVSDRVHPDVDLFISSAADLQFKLANDGYAVALDPVDLGEVPEWARWRNELVGFTYEPAVIIYNRDLVPDDKAPHSHSALTELLEEGGTRYSGRVGTYDIGKSGVGYLLAAQDAQISSNFWRLARALGRNRVFLSGSSPELIEDVANGRLALAYNVLGSYARARVRTDPRLGVIIPSDYVLVLTRTMLIPRTADNPALAGRFVDYALSQRGQAILTENGLGSAVRGTAGPWSEDYIQGDVRGIVQPITLGPALLAALDRERRARFLSTWSRLVTPEPQ